MKQIIKKTVFTSLLAMFFLGCSSGGDSNMTEEPETITEEPETSTDTIFMLEAGNYTGTWNSTTPTKTFTDLPISARISEVSSGDFEGEFFISAGFASCCNSGANDGTIGFSIDENDLNDFSWDDIIPNCTGTFTGNGELTDENAISISITGADCDGNHTGTIKLSKI